MTAQGLSIATIANNLANVNTTGFKKARVDFRTCFVPDVASTVEPR